MTPEMWGGLGLLVGLAFGIWSSQASYQCGANDGYGYAHEPTNPGYRKAGRWLFRYTRHRWKVRDPDDTALEGELSTLFKLIDQEQFDDARAAMLALERKLGSGEPELTRAAALIRFLEHVETPVLTAEELAIRFHDTYERLAPSFGYETRTETRNFDPTTPNGRLMIAVCGELLPAMGGATTKEQTT